MLSTTWTVPWQQVHAVPMGIIQPQTLPAATSPVRHTSLPSSQSVLRKLCTTLLTLVAGATWGMWLYKEPSGLFIAVLLWNCQILGNEELKLPLGQCWPPPAQQPRRTKGSRESVPGDEAYRSFQSCCCPRPPFNPLRAQLWAHLALSNRAENVSFPNETLQQGAQAKWRDRSIQCCCNTWAWIYPGHQLTCTDLTGTAVPFTS